MNASNKGTQSTLATRSTCELYHEAHQAHAVVSPDAVPPEKTPDILDVCGRDEILAANFRSAHERLRIYTEHSTAARLAGMAAYTEPATPSAGTEGQDEDIEFVAAPIVQMVTGYVLPFTFGIIGSLLFVLLQHYTDLQANLLIPRDLPLAYLRLALGVVVAASVSMLMTSTSGPTAPLVPSASGSTPPSSLVGSLSLTANLVTFLAGFGAEAVFKLLQELVQRIFASPADKTSAPVASPRPATSQG